MNRFWLGVRAGWGAVLLLAWVAFIFGTSCTVIQAEEFFVLVHRGLGLSADALERFKIFWGISWFAVVKGWHALEFGLLLLLLVTAIQQGTGKLDARKIGLAMGLCVLFAISDEWHQSFIPDRMGTVTDVLIDSLGVALAGVGLFWWRRRKCATAADLSSVGSAR